MYSQISTIDHGAAPSVEALPVQAIAALLCKIKNHFYVYDPEQTCLYNGFQVYVDNTCARIKMTPGRRALDLIVNVPSWQVEETDYSLIAGYSLNRSGDFCLGRDLNQQVRLMPLCSALRMFQDEAMANRSIYPVLHLSDLNKVERGLSAGLQFYHLHVHELFIAENQKLALSKDVIAKLRAYLMQHDARGKAIQQMHRS